MVEANWNVVAGADKGQIVEGVKDLVVSEVHPLLFGTGAVAEQCVRLLGYLGFCVIFPLQFCRLLNFGHYFS